MSSVTPDILAGVSRGLSKRAASGDAGHPGKIIIVNDNDDDGDGIPDFADGFNRDGANGTADEQKDDMNAEEHFVPLGPLKSRALIPGKALRRAMPGLVGRFFRGPHWF